MQIPSAPWIGCPIWDSRGESSHHRPRPPGDRAGAGRLNYGGAALKGAVSGAFPGALIGWLFGLFDLINPLVASAILAFYGLIIGAVVGGVLGLVMHALQRGRRDFDAVTMTVPSRFEVVVDEDVADEAARLAPGGGQP